MNPSFPRRPKLHERKRAVELYSVLMVVVVVVLSQKAALEGWWMVR